MPDNRPVFIISATRFIRGGSVEIVNDLLQFLDRSSYAERYRIIALVSDRNLYAQFNNIEARSFPQLRKGLFKRICFEYVSCYFISKQLRPHVWLSMQDSTPNVIAEKRFVYWHNALFQRGIVLSDLIYESKLFFLSLLYRYIYPSGIRKNDRVFVQQECLKGSLAAKFNIQLSKIKVVHPEFPFHNTALENNEAHFIFLYPSYPSAYKNMDAALKAFVQVSDPTIELWLTCKGNENSYSRKLRSQYGHLQNVKWLGYRSHDRMTELYRSADALIYLSSCESWGLPISIFQQMNKPMILADLPYAHETANDHVKACFHSPGKIDAIARSIQHMANGTMEYHECSITATDTGVSGWRPMIELMLNE